MLTFIVGSGGSQTTTIALPATTSIDCAADFIVGANNALGNHLHGTLDFMRVCQATLADAQTSIAEVTAWQTDGPWNRDYFGNSIVGTRDAGAVEIVEPLRPSHFSSRYDADATGIELVWIDQSAIEDGYRLQRSTTADFTDNLITFDLPANATRYLDDTIQKEIRYYYRLQLMVDGVAVIDGGVVSNGISLEQPDAPELRGFHFNSTDSTLYLDWVIANPEIGKILPARWNVSYATTSGGPYTTISGLTASETTITGIDAAATYFVVIEAVNQGGSTAMTEQQMFDSTGAGWFVQDAENAEYKAQLKALDGSMTGTGMLLIQHDGDAIEWTTEVAEAGDHQLAIRYQHGRGGGSVRLLINGSEYDPAFPLPKSGGWNVWAAAALTLPLDAGITTIRIEDNGSEAFNIDALFIEDYDSVDDPNPGPGIDLQAQAQITNPTHMLVTWSDSNTVDFYLLERRHLQSGNKLAVWLMPTGSNRVNDHSLGTLTPSDYRYDLQALQASTLPILLAEQLDIVPLDLGLTQQVSGDDILVDWQDISDADWYFLSRQCQGQSNQVMGIFLPVDPTEYLDTMVDAVQEYTYQVSAGLAAFLGNN